MCDTMKKIIRATTVPISLKTFCNGMLKELSKKYEVVAVSSAGADLDYVAEHEGVRPIPLLVNSNAERYSDWDIKSDGDFHCASANK